MEEKNIEKLRDAAEELIPYLNDKNYDFGDIGSELIVKINELVTEKIKQDKIIEAVKTKITDKFFEYFAKLGKKDDFDVIFDDYFSNVFRIESYQNYYLVSFCGTSHMDMNFVFDKNGKLLVEDGIVYGLDNNNFFVIRNNNKNLVDKLYNFSSLYHFQLNDDIFKLVNVLDNVNDIDFNDFFDKNLVVCCSGEDKILYNYKNVEIVIPSFSLLCKDLGNFEVIEGDDLNYIRVVKKLYGVDNYKSILKSNLEFLADKKGNVVSFVSDFENGYWNFLLPLFGDTQEERLNNLYEDAYRKNKVCRRIKKQN